MFNPLIWLDSKLLGIAQKFCDKVQRTTGMTKFALERLALMTTLFTMLAANSFIGFLGSVMSTVFTVMIVILFLVSVGMERAFLKTGKLWHSSSSSAFDRISWALLFCLVLAALGVAIVAGESFDMPMPLILGAKLLAVAMISTIAHIYISACVPRPPSKSKAREIYEKVLIAINDSLKPAPVPAPN